MSARVGSAFELIEMVALPLWAAAVLAACFLVVCVLAFLRGGPDGKRAAAARVALILIAALAGSLFIDYLWRRDLAGDRLALEARAHDLNARAIMPGSALACLDAMAGDAVENSCERALFATPEATAAAVSYVAAQLSLLTAGTELFKRGDLNSESPLADLRRAAELDRFGFVAHVLMVRDGCTAEQCGTFSLLRDAQRVRTNMARRTYESFVNLHAGNWGAPGNRPVAAHSRPGTVDGQAAAPVAAAKPPNNLFFPSAASIPPVSIMNSEPNTQPPNTTGSAETATPSPPRKRPQGQARQPANSPANATNATSAAPPAPMQLAPSGQ
jgi:hypothetical protein